MPVCSKCEGDASYLLDGRWYCQTCMQSALDKPAPPVLSKKVSLLDAGGRVVKMPFCSICHDRIAMVVAGSVGKCRDCFRAKRAWPDVPDEPDESEDIPQKPQRPHLGSSIIDFPDEYVCVDVETTGLSPSEDEIIEVSALLVRGGEVRDARDVFTSLVRPARSHVPWTYEEIHALGYNSYDDVPRAVFEDDSCRRILPAEIVGLTKITNEMIRDASGEEAVFPGFYDFVGDRVLVGHNAMFDIQFLYDACLRCGLLLKNDYIDTKRIARNLLPDMMCYDLASLAKRLGVEQSEAHRAEADTRVTVKCLEAMKDIVLQRQTIPEYIEGFIDPPRKRSRRFKAYGHGSFHPSDLVRPETVDTSHPLCGKSIVFTGELGLSRQDAAQLATDAGASVKTAVSGKTNFLVVGRQDAGLVGSSGISGKEKKAKELNDSGKGHIQILSEQEFMDMIQQKTEAGVR